MLDGGQGKLVHEACGGGTTAYLVVVDVHGGDGVG